MTRLGLILAATIAAALPLRAAATVYSFAETDTGGLGAEAFDFSLDTATGVLQPDGTTTTFAPVTILSSGTAVLDQTVFTQYGTAIGSPLFYLIDTDPSMRPFSTGDGSDVAFNTGRFAIAQGGTDGEGFLTISAAPEPSAWALLIAGAGLAGLALRRRHPSVEAPV